MTTVFLSAGGNIILPDNPRRHAKPWACRERQANGVRHPSSPTRVPLWIFGNELAVRW